MESGEKLDQDIKCLQAAKDKWVTIPIDRKISLLKELKRNLGRHAAEWVELSVKNKKIENYPALAGEEWSTGPWAVLKAINAYIKTLEHVQKGNPEKLIKKISQRRNGQLKLTVFPADVYDSLLFNGIKAEIWMQEGISKHNISSLIASFYRQKKPKGKVSLVLSAGNVNSISPLDVLYKLFVEGEVVMMKLNPVNSYLISPFIKIAKTLIEEDFLRIVEGGAETGEYLTRHPGIETIHITGSVTTFNAIVFGTGPEGEKRRKENRPLLDPGKTITGELGNVGPLIVVPGPWNKADIRYQAENIVTAKLHNSGYNCVAAQVLVLPEKWDKSKALLDETRKLLKTLPPRESYYPGTDQREQEFMKAYPHVEKIGDQVPRIMVSGLKPGKDNEYVFTHELFGPMLAQTYIGGDTPLDYLRNAINFCNNDLYGTLGATILIHPKTIKEIGADFEDCIADLKYGAIGINVWNAVTFMLPQCPWGAYPGHTYDDIQSGIGVVHNSLMLEKTEKSVLYGPFRTLPRAFNLAPPRPPWFVTNKRADVTLKKITRFEADGKISRLPGILISALQG